MTTPAATTSHAIPVSSGQIRRAPAPRPDRNSRLFLLADPAGPAGEFRVGHLLTPDTDMDTGVEAHLPADRTAGRPYDLLVHEFPTYLDPARLGPCLWQPAKSEYLPRYSDLADLLTPGSVRWEWKLSELDAANAHMVALCCLLGECAQESDRAVTCLRT